MYRVEGLGKPFVRRLKAAITAFRDKNPRVYRKMFCRTQCSLKAACENGYLRDCVCHPADSGVAVAFFLNQSGGAAGGAGQGTEDAGVGRVQSCRLVLPVR